VLDLEDVKKFLNMNKRGQKPSFEGYNEPEAKKENMMNVGELDQKFFTTPEVRKNRNNRNRRSGNRPQGDRPQRNNQKISTQAEGKSEVNNSAENRPERNKPLVNKAPRQES